MNKRINRLTGGLIATAAAGAAVVSMTTVAAHAATTFTPSGGPNANFVASRLVSGSPVSGVKFTDIPAGQALTCTSFSVSGSIVSPGTSRTYGANAGNLGSLSAGGCTNPLAGATTVTPVGTWGVTITGDAVSGLWPAKLTNVKANLAAANCTFSVEGVVNGKFSNTTQRFTPNSTTAASGLVVSSTPAPSGTMCVTLDIQPGDDIAIDGYFTNTPPSGSTNLTVANP